jgi:hypothetical protein
MPIPGQRISMHPLEPGRKRWAGATISFAPSKNPEIQRKYSTSTFEQTPSNYYLCIYSERESR